MSPAVSVNTSGRRARLRLLHRWLPPAEIILPDVSARGLFWQQLLLWLQGGFASRNTFGTKNPELSIPLAVTLTLAQLLSPLVTQSVTGSFFGLLKTPLMNGRSRPGANNIRANASGRRRPSKVQRGAGR